MGAVVALDTLFNGGQVWKGRPAPPAASPQPTGHAALDAALPSGGWPEAALSEILLAGPGVGELQLVWPTLARLSAAGERIVLVMARRAGRYIAGAINFRGANTLYGRNWGCIEDHPFLHFEVCYHQAIDFAIAHGLGTVEAGAQGEHKLARGYLPVTTRSAHYIADADFRAAVASYLTRERAYVAETGEELTELGPFRHNLDAEADEP